jgi:hypothetical protein
MSAGNSIPFAAINAAALARLPSLLREWFPHGKKDGHEWRVASINGEAGESFSVNTQTGEWAEFNGLGTKGRDVISLYAAKYCNGKQGEAARQLADELGIDIKQSKRQEQTAGPEADEEQWTPMIPPPPDAGLPPDEMLAGFDLVHRYTSLDDRETHYVGRIEARGEKRKQFIPITYGTLTENGKTTTEWHKKAPAVPRPLYGLNRLIMTPDAVVILCEGEKAADAAQRLFPGYACLSWFGGTAQVDGADLAPLATRDLIIWPDNDAPGLEAVRKLLPRLSTGTQVVRTASLPDKFDAADLERQGSDDPSAWLNARLHAVSGYTHVWQGKNLEIPCTPLGEEHDAPDGRTYVRVRQYDGVDGYAPKDELFTKEEIQRRPSTPTVGSEHPLCDKDDAGGGTTFNELLAKAELLKKNDLKGLKALIADMIAARLEPIEVDAVLKAAKGSTGSAIGLLRKEFEAAKARDEHQKRNSPGAQAERERLRQEEERKREADARAERRTAEEERQRLEAACHDLAHDPDLLSNMADLADRIGVVGERPATVGAYITMTSRLLIDDAISLLRRGAPASGKNYLLNSVARLMPRRSVIPISSSSPMALIYYGNDENALKHKIIFIAEAAAIAQKHNGDEHPMAVMLRTLLSEKRIDRYVAIPQKSSVPRTEHVVREGPVAMLLTSARENVEEEMLTRLLVSDADESRDQTLAVVERILNGTTKPVTYEIERWVDYQRWLELDAPYTVAVPFAGAIYAAYKQLIKSLPGALQLRMRRDITGLLSAVKASAVIHRAQRPTDESGRIVAELVDYRHAWGAFNQSVASLYGVKFRNELIAVAEAAAKLGLHQKGLGDSVKLTVAALGRALGINSKATAGGRLNEAIERGVLEEDYERRGAGRGRPRFCWLLQTAATLRSVPASPVFPDPRDVETIFFNASGAEGAETAEQDEQDGVAI